MKTNTNDRVVIFRSFREAIRGLPDDVRLEILEAIIDYGLDGAIPDFKNQIAKSIFLMAQPNLDFSDKKRKKRGNPNFGKGRPNPYYQGDNSGDNSQHNSRDNYVDNSEDNSADNSSELSFSETPINTIIPDNSSKDIGIRNKDIGIGKGIIPPIIPPQDGRVGFEFHGTFHNVELKPAELRKLQMDFGEEETQSAIDDLSCKLMDGTQQSTAHYATLTYWLANRKKKKLREKEKEPPKGRDLIGNDNEFISD